MLKSVAIFLALLVETTPFAIASSGSIISDKQQEKIEQTSLEDRHKVIAENISTHFDSQFYKLPLRKQGHYALRRYRTTGKTEFLNASLCELYIAADRLSSLCNGIQNKSYRYDQLRKEAETESMLGINKTRAVLRKESIKKYPDHVFFAHLVLPELNRVNEMGMQLKGKGEHLRQVLSGFNFKAGFSDPDMIRSWAARQANQVYWLYNMLLGDYRKIYIDTFKKVYPDNKDQLLSDQQYRTKITGMTHLIISASSYFQEPVNDYYLSWVTNYFQNKIDSIMSRVDLGALSEVGVSLLLTGKKDSIAVEKITKRLVNSYNPEYKMIPGVHDQLDVASTQHRNLLASIFLGWSGDYYPGPYLYKMKQFSTNIPSVLEREHGY